MGKKGRKKQTARSSGGGGDKWTVNDIRAILHNPVYAGIGPFPPIIDEQTWIGAQERMVRDDGAEAVLGQIRQAIRDTFGDEPEWMSEPGWLSEAARDCERRGTQAFFRGFLHALREAYGSDL